MKYNLAEVFSGVAHKRLSATEVDPEVSHGHEFQGVRQIATVLGKADQKFHATFVYLCDEQEPQSQRSEMSWYDSRRGQPHRKPEWRLYYAGHTTLVQETARAGDLIVIGLKHDGELAVMVAKSGSTWERQLGWLFNVDINSVEKVFQVEGQESLGAQELGWAARTVLEALGIEPPVEYLVDPEDVNAQFPYGFPSTRELSEFARKVAGNVDPRGDPDQALLQWVTVEEQVFRVLELRQWESDRAINSPCDDLDNFIEVSKSYQNRRKSRAGSSFENQLEHLFLLNGLVFKRGGRTEGNRKPDFLFPSEEAYHDVSYPAERLTILGAKTSCKDRWRQVLSEGARVKVKHLATLEPAISETQTAEMRTSDLRLVVPREIALSYTDTQREWLMSLEQFIRAVKQA